MSKKKKNSQKRGGSRVERGNGGAQNQRKKKQNKPRVHRLPFPEPEEPGRVIPDLATKLREYLGYTVKRYEDLETTHGGTNSELHRKYYERLVGDGETMKALKPHLLAFLEIRLALKQLDSSLRIITREVAARRRRLIANRRRLRRLRGRRPLKGRPFPKGTNGTGVSTSTTPPSPGNTSTFSPKSTPTSGTTSSQASRRGSGGSGGSSSGAPADRDQILLPAGVKEMLKKQRNLAISTGNALQKLNINPEKTPSAVGNLREWLLVQLINTVKKIDSKYHFEAGGSSSGSRSST